MIADFKARHKSENLSFVHSPLPTSDVELNAEWSNKDLDIADTSSKDGGVSNSNNYQSNETNLSLANHIWHWKKSRPKVFMIFCILGTAFLVFLLVLLLRWRQSSFFEHSQHQSNPETSSNAYILSHFQANSSKGAVASDCAACSDVGVNILSIGGNAFDAAAATVLCLGVISPASSGLGGGAHILYFDATEKRASFIDSRETAPAESTPDMFDEDPLQSQNGGRAIAILAELKGLYKMQQEHGALKWAQCTYPAARLAENYVVSEELASLLLDKDVLPYLESGKYPALSNLFIKSDGTVKVAGDIIKNTKLSHTLDMIGLYGSDYIYKTMAPTLAAEIKDAGGIVTKEDIESYDVQVHTPIESRVMGHTMYAASGSSSGGATVASITKFMEGFSQPLASQGLVYNHRLVEAMKNAFSMRLNLGDPAFVNVTSLLHAMTSSSYIKSLRDSINDDHVSDLASYGGEFGFSSSKWFLNDDHGTSHVCVVDKEGNAVSLTSTVNTFFGSKVVSPSTGILFNNQMVGKRIGLFIMHTRRIHSNCLKFSP